MTVETTSSGARELRLLTVKTVGLIPFEYGVSRFSLSAGQPPSWIGFEAKGSDNVHFWGSGILDWFDYTYIYGWDFNHSYLARAPRGDVLGDWEFRTASGWSDEEADAVPLADPQGQAISAQAATAPIYRDGRFVMLAINGHSWRPSASDPGGAPRGEIQAWTAPNTWGPWSGPTNIYAPPEAQDRNAQIYNLATHPEISLEPLLISYNVLDNSCNGTTPGSTQNADGYRPRFVRVSAP
jgi:hypothetical protein